MKAKKLFLSAVVLLCSCTKTENIEYLTSEDNVSESNAVSVCEALTNLDNELRSIYGPDTRLDANQRKVKTVNRIDFKSSRAKDGGTECPLYIVEFEDNKGSAVLSADRRVEPVLAILDNDVLTESDFTANDSEKIKPYIASLIRQYANNSLNDVNLDLRPIDPGFGIDTIYHYVRKPLIKTKWHQGSPYNNECIAASGIADHPAGCAAIAVSQLVKFHKCPENLTLNSQTFDWDLLNLCDYGISMTNNAKIEVAKFVYNIGLSLGINYAGGKSGTNNKKISNGLKTIGYKNVNIQNYSDSDPRTYIYTNSRPVLITGYIPNSEEGHAWLLDGWNEYKIKGLKMLIDGTSEIVYTTTTKVHCNYGWGGQCDGYYASGIFDASKRLSSDDIDLSIGDIPSFAVNLSKDLRIFKFNLQ